MKVAEYHSNEDVRIVDMPVPEVGEGEILVKTKVCGICGSDVLEWYRRMRKSPFFGHEVSGIIEKVGKGVKELGRGDRVFIHHHVPCFTCHYCRRGSYTMCPTYHRTNLDPSGFAEYIRVPRTNVENGGVIKLPDNISFEEASLIEPMGCCMRGLKRTNLQMGDTVLVVGTGFAGLVHIQIAKMMGAGLIIASDFFDFKLQEAKKMGADVVVNPGKEKVKEKLYEVNEGRGADVVVVTPPSTRVIKEAIEFLDRGGTLYLFGPTSPDDYLSILPYTFFFSELSLITSYSASPIETNAVCRLMQEGKITTQGLITHRFKLDQIGEAVRVAARADESLKVIVNFE
ncbi:alcohol dehydrogenase catalytic domain-containing protein [Candidatus Aerophobetes bacterium]|nr:alcohol dehydrogenase catalytic domain-containing protein [Candidatus Aerophobetes bacterium]